MNNCLGKVSPSTFSHSKMEKYTTKKVIDIIHWNICMPFIILLDIVHVQKMFRVILSYKRWSYIFHRKLLFCNYGDILKSKAICKQINFVEK